MCPDEELGNVYWLLILAWIGEIQRYFEIKLKTYLSGWTPNFIVICKFGDTRNDLTYNSVNLGKT